MLKIHPVTAWPASRTDFLALAALAVFPAAAAASSEGLTLSSRSSEVLACTATKPSVEVCGTCKGTYPGARGIRRQALDQKPQTRFDQCCPVGGGAVPVTIAVMLHLFLD